MNKDKTDDIKLVFSVILSDNKRAFDKLVIKYQSQIRRFFLNLTNGNTTLSDDLAQETFIKAYIHIRSFKAVSGFSTWLFRIAYNVFYDWTRRRKHWQEIDCKLVDSLHNTDNAFSAEKEDIYKALSILREQERTVILLFYMEDKTQKEISNIVNYPLGTVKTHLLKGKEKIEKYLKANGYEK